ncbi:MAG: hypothetical protein ACXVEF_31880 [Polyangiales bacterium]
MRLGLGMAACTSAALLLLLPTAANADAKKFAVAMPHFNVQYVAGGMVGFWPMPDPRLDLNAEQIEDQIIVESFEPVLDLYAKHPTWATDVEMQGYMLDVISKRHPSVLAKIKDLVTKGQLEVVSFHYSDQLFLAHAYDDWRYSADLNKKTFDSLGIPIGGAVFCQEGQAGMGMADAMKVNGQQVMVWPKNLWSYQHGDAQPDAPLFTFGDVWMTTSRGGTWDLGGGNSVEINWTFVDDGELLMTGGAGPYTPDVFHKKQSAVDKYEMELAALETAGFQITTVSKMAEQIKAMTTPPAPPPLLDGTWQPNSTDGIRKWLGGSGLHQADERDNDVRSLAQIAHRELVAARTIAEKSGMADATKADLEAAFRLLALAEVSDASGINPFRGEIEYGLAHTTEALRIARKIIAAAKKDPAVAIDSAAGTVTANPPAPAAPTTIDAPIKLVAEGDDRPVTIAWTKAAHPIATITFGPGTSQTISVTVPGAPDLDIGYTPGLTSTPVHVPRSAFVFDHYMFALHDGLFAIGKNQWILKDQAFVHLAARIEKKSGDIVFKDDTANPDETITWVFHLIDGDDTAAADAAKRLNVFPTVIR